MTLKTRITCVRRVLRGDTIGYGRAYMAPRDMRVGLLPVGYADGYSREFSNLGRTLIHRRFAPLIGRVCMDQCTVDLTDIPEARVGDEVVLYGRQGSRCLLIDDLARSISSIPNVLVTSLGPRVPRVYVQKAETG